ncbi:Farnesylated proteins-converting enzyme 2 [Aphelenchoides fujianensis]|nr:Farnesylated proteins-converting enzyme 2 [Aphelenchoides fujianensis]
MEDSRVEAARRTAMGVWISALTAIGIPVAYVGSLYLFDRQEFHQNHPQTIKRRFVGVALSTSLTFGLTVYLLSREHEWPLERMGLTLSLDALWKTLKSTAVLLSLYFGTIVMELDECGQKARWNWFKWSSWRESLSEWMWWKNIVVAPFTEELAFRGCSAVLLRDAFGTAVAMYVGPLFFSCCHYHHLLDDVRQGDTWTRAILERTVQGAYTYLFGLYATYLAFGCGNLLPAIAAHAVCNRFGLPRVFELAAFDFRSPRPFVYAAAHLIGLSCFLFFLPALGTC